MAERQTIVDHEGDRVTHRKKRVNGVRLHYYTAGSGEPLLLLHGVPKTAYYWRKLVPLLTEDYEVVVPDQRGFGDSEMTDGSHDMETMGDDAAKLMEALGHDEYHVVGEDWGATAGLALAGQYPDRVKTLSFLEMIMDGFGLQEWSFLTEEAQFWESARRLRDDLPFAPGESVEFNHYGGQHRTYSRGITTALSGLSPT